MDVWLNICLCIYDRYKILHNENLWKLDGLNSMKFLDTKLLAVTNHRLYTNITVEVGESPDMILWELAVLVGERSHPRRQWL